MHTITSALDRLRCDLTVSDDAATYLELIRAYAAAHPERPAILGGGWSMAAFPGGTPDRALLDAIVPDRPVALDNRDGHGTWVNSKAFELAGIDDDTPEPARGRIERRADGSLQGTLHEGASDLVWDVLPKPEPDEWLEAARMGQRELLGYGITAWQDASGYDNDLFAYRRLAETGELVARVISTQRWSRHHGVEQLEGLIDTSRDLAIGRLRADRIKILLDGIVENSTAAMLEPYLDAGRPTDRRIAACTTSMSSSSARRSVPSTRPACTCTSTPSVTAPFATPSTPSSTPPPSTRPGIDDRRWRTSRSSTRPTSRVSRPSAWSPTDSPIGRSRKRRWTA